jgi:hypothetical protein
MLRIIALAAMLLDHIGIVFFPDVIFLHVIGRIAYPLFAWGIATGYKRTRNTYSYAARILVLAIISQIPYRLLFNNDYINVCFTLLAGLAAIILFDKVKSKYLKYPGIFTLLIISHFARFDYGVYGVLTVLLFYLFGSKDSLFLIYGVLTVISTVIFRYEPVQVFAALSPILILFTSKYELRINRLLQYGFYPLHLSLLLIISYFVVRR